MNKDRIIAELEAENARLTSEASQRENEIERLKHENEKLKLLTKYYEEQLRLAVHRQFGASSEKTEIPAQVSLFNEAEVHSDENVPEPDLEAVIVRKRKKKSKGKREEFYDDIPIEQIIHELPEDERVCPECGGSLHACGHAVLRRELEIIPAQVRTVEHVQTVYSCRVCEKNAADDAVPMLKSSVPSPVISGSGVASPSLLSFVLSNKYVLALPLHRQQQELERIGVNISRQTMANWVIYVAKHWLKPIYNLLRAELLLNDILHADETTVQVIKEESRKASQKSYMWLYHTGRDAARQIALYEYQATRDGEHPLNFLKGFVGYLHVDAYAGYRGLEVQGVTLVECWAHVRRKFYDALKAVKKEDRDGTASNIGLNYCNELFKLERQYDEAGISHEERAERRNLESKPVAEKFFAWSEDMVKKALPKSKFGEAVGYAVNQKNWLMNFLLDGRLELSNNRAENSIRPFTIGRKNWLFSYCKRGAEASAVVYSIVETAQANGLVPFIYLNYLFQTLPNIPSERYSECLPWNPAVKEICKISKKLKKQGVKDNDETGQK
jgi:transposase